jgi:hypothetical protein
MASSMALIGMPEQGKSKFVTNYLKDTPQRGALVYDVNGYEYGDKWGVNLSLDIKQKRCRYVGRDLPEVEDRYKTFMELVRGRQNTDVVFEEATGYMAGRLQNKIVTMVIDRRHTGNNYIFMFHSIHSVPPSLLLHLSFIYLFKTEDEEDQVKAKSRKLVAPWKIMQSRPYGSPGLLLNWNGKKYDTPGTPVKKELVK